MCSTRARLATHRFVGKNLHRVWLRIATEDPHGLHEIIDLVTEANGSMASLTTQEPSTGGLVAEMEVRVPDLQAGIRLTSAIGDHAALRLLESKALGE